jgi:uncharacterized repeat protein (TIGR03803 family)
VNGWKIWRSYKVRLTTIFAVALQSLIGSPPVFAQSNIFNVLFTFPALPPNDVFSGTATNDYGADPMAGLILSNNTLFGAAQFGGPYGAGIVFAINTDGSGFTNLHNFIDGTNEGFEPTGLGLSGNTLYGTTEIGGSGGRGTVFRVNTDGSGFTNLHSFAPSDLTYDTNADGIQPLGGVIISGNILYGTAGGGGTWGSGTVFRLNTDGTGFTNLHSFDPFASNGSALTNSDGFGPYAGLILSGNTLFGKTLEGGLFGGGTIFKLNSDGSDFTNLQNFTLVDDFEAGGSHPSFILSGNTLYGTASDSGSTSAGSIFRINTDGSDFTNFYLFSGVGDGSRPHGLILSGKTLYGMATIGGSGDSGTLFSINTNGGNFTTLYSFPPDPSPEFTNSGGDLPQGGLVLSGNTLYGTATAGGLGGQGTVFALTLVPPLSIASAGNQIAISWPAWATNYVLQTATDLSSGNWNTITNGFVTNASGYFFTTNATSQAAYFRLQQP